MPTVTPEDLQRDPLALSVAHAMTLANETASQAGIDLAASLVTVSEEYAASARQWRVHYGPRDYIGRRGGDFVVVVDDPSGQVRQVLRGQ
jgi:hypothetical protein